MRMKQEHDPIERLAFHLITDRNLASTIANEGLTHEQLSLPTKKYLGEFTMVFARAELLTVPLSPRQSSRWCPSVA